MSILVAKPSRALALGEAVLVNLVWASSFVLVKQALAYMGPLTITGLRYFLGFMLLLPVMLMQEEQLERPTNGQWWRLILLGISAYTIGNGAMFWGLKSLSATTGAFMMSLVPLLLIWVSVFWLREIPTRWQLLGLGIGIVGSVLFFMPGREPLPLTGLALGLLALLAFTLFGVLGREVARTRALGVLTLTAYPLAIGGGLSLLVALWLEGLPAASGMGWGIVLWLALVNTAIAYVLYNHSLQELTALEMTVLMNLSPFVTALMAWWLLGEQLSARQLVGMAIVVAGVIIVQGTGRPRPRKEVIR